MLLARQSHRFLIEGSTLSAIISTRRAPPIVLMFTDILNRAELSEERQIHADTIHALL